jgi:hypothetical protein
MICFARQDHFGNCLNLIESLTRLSGGTPEMKSSIKIHPILLLIIFCNSISYGQLPTYNLRAMNYEFYGCPHNIVEFDVYMEHTNAPAYFEYSMGQYFFNFNPAIANGGTLTYSIVGSDLPPALVPKNPTISGSQLRLATNLPAGAGNGFDMTNNGYPGTKIVRLRLTTTASEMNGLPSLVWRSALPNPYTKIFAYVNGVNMEITTAATHSVTEFYHPYCERFLLNSPAFNLTNVNIPVSLSWYRASAAVSYKVLVSDNPGFSNILFADSSFTDTFKTVLNLNLNTTYYWRVSAYNGSSYYITSPVWYFKTGDNPGGIPPTYSLVARNFQLNSPADNRLEFDIYIQHTNPPVVFEFSAIQMILNFNPNIANGGVLTYSLVSSDLPPSLQPRSPSVQIISTPPETVMVTAVNPFPSPGNGFIMTDNGYPGTKIARMRLETSAPSFTADTANIRWRNFPNPSFVTRVYAFVGTVNTDITTPATHSVEYDNDPLPVSLASFGYSTIRNSVKLVWTTSAETDNKGFTIERKSGKSGQWEVCGNVPGYGNSAEARQYSFTDKILQPGNYNYRLKQIDYNGNFMYHELSGDVVIGKPGRFNLSQNYPNPFNPSTKIDFDLPDDGRISITIYDISGREIGILLNEERKAGYYYAQFNAADLASGVYFCRAEFSSKHQNSVATKKMMVIK